MGLIYPEPWMDPNNRRTEGPAHADTDSVGGERLAEEKCHFKDAASTARVLERELAVVLSGSHNGVPPFNGVFTHALRVDPALQRGIECIGAEMGLNLSLDLSRRLIGSELNSAVNGL